jgi:curved DNA-binding protein
MNYYDILGVDKSATDEQIKNAYRQAAKKYHPDINKDPGADAKFKEISEAYEAIKDSDKRRQYDAEQQFSRFNSMGGGNHFFFDEGFNINDIFEHLNGRSGFRQRPTRNRDINLNYTISLLDAFKGKEQEIKFKKPNGDTQNITVVIPPGISTGQKIRYAGMGENTQTNLPPGDLYVHINVANDQHFIRHGIHLSTTVQIDYIDAILGMETIVETIDRQTLKVKIPEGVTVGQVLRIPGKGMPIFDRSTERGDLMIELMIVPPKLTDDQKDILRDIKK